MQASSNNLQIFLKERSVKSIHKMAELTEQYYEAHGQYETNHPRPQEIQTKPYSASQGKHTLQFSDRQYIINTVTIVNHPHILVEIGLR